VTAFDFTVGTVLIVSVLWSLWRGAVREVFAIAGWVLAFLVANHYAEAASVWLPDSVSDDTMRYLLALTAVFVLVLLAVHLLGSVLAGGLRALGLGVFDRVLGIAFGVLRGALLILLGVMLAGMTPLPQTAAWRNAVSSASLEAAVEWARPSLPQAFAERIRYD